MYLNILLYHKIPLYSMPLDPVGIFQDLTMQPLCDAI